MGNGSNAGDLRMFGTPADDGGVTLVARERYWPFERGQAAPVRGETAASIAERPARPLRTALVRSHATQATDGLRFKVREAAAV